MMSNVEERLDAAAAETRRLAATRTPVPISQPQRGKPRGWLAFAAAFAVVIVTFGLIPLLTGGNESQPADDSTPVSSAPADTASTETTADVSCSAAGASVPSAAAGLPEPVATTRQAIIDAAAACDLDALEGLAAEGFNSSFGGGGVENLRRWEDEGTGRLGTLLDLFGMTHDTVETDDGVIYVWPAAHVYESWDAIPADLIEELRQIHTDEELDMFSEFGSYGGWRTGIDQDGNWLYFVAGD